MVGSTAQTANYTTTMITYRMLENCPHKNRKTKVLETLCGCEKTVIVCADCNKELEKPKTEC
ncbi:hypothetical protein N4T20_02645 [Flavobacterium sp. TR2]|uniref:hypothetical protein n=1 Tax=Flavobacterium sp. TR2 TaxID=2977321 RepID=UPI0021B0A234|nr:hypothetical protein [Flavobacterium sp. TR2]UWY28830.1 hypothetical protein N4T20_02645 [Flavobacterium sp. TR2]